MWSIAQIAARDGVSKPTVSIRVKRFVEQHDLAVERDARGNVVAVNVAQYDALRGRFDDPSKAQQPKPQERTELPKDGESYDEALRQKTWLETERRRIDLETIKGKLVDTQAVAEGYDRAATVILDVLGRLEEQADDLAAIVAKDGVRGLAPVLKRVAAEFSAEMVRALKTEANNLRASIVEDAPSKTQ
ncbi:hypothetical protein GJ654_18735 [Rhodoblastus acidophilus]|uniref:Uncharacterized protein n=1 Tax=Rhodoblastus acidophilus TaxID=1074 RepID=A0A6N8DR31_RHOAC|nr:hypothetical protein [Rhodoblastus acidophilus]MCW2276365.1 putative membrane protein [Rhodoblastus acidophilus]MTV33020.1 hypothetical protein [Rhodoblastus acidophilus]